MENPTNPHPERPALKPSPPLDCPASGRGAEAKPIAYYSKATVVPTQNGCFIFPASASNHFLKPEVMAARLVLKFKAPPMMHEGILHGMQTRFELHEVYVYDLQVKATIKEPNRPDVEFEDNYEIILIFDTQE